MGFFQDFFHDFSKISGIFETFLKIFGIFEFFFEIFEIFSQIFKNLLKKCDKDFFRVICPSCQLTETERKEWIEQPAESVEELTYEHEADVSDGWHGRLADGVGFVHVKHTPGYEGYHICHYHAQKHLEMRMKIILLYI